jgi:DNA-binding XRE family transcriptional regulator
MSRLSIVQAAEGLGISKQTLQDLEHGTGTVGLGLALRVANQLEVALFMAPASRKEVIRRRVASDS